MFASLTNAFGLWGLAREFRLILACVVGVHSEAMARTLITKTLAVLTLVAGIPLFVSDGLAHYATVLLEQFHKVVSFPRTGKRGRPRTELYPQNA